MTLLKQIIRTAINIPGWHTSRKIVVIESDDWGSIRMPSKAVYNDLLSKGLPVDRLPFLKYDSLASESDLKALFEVLSDVKDKNGNPAIITANTNVVNPDFEKIKQSGYKEYHYELFTDTLKRYPEHGNSFELWKEGMRHKLWRPQFHGREHLNVISWMDALQNDKGLVRMCLDYNMYDLSEGKTVTVNSFVEALNFQDKSELDFQKKSLIDGLNIFEQIFGYRSSTYIAPCYIWSTELNETLIKNGITAFQGGWYQFVPLEGSAKKHKRIFHYTGEKNQFNQRYLVRNVHFEPSLKQDNDNIDALINQIDFVFHCRKPVIISSHRINFSGYIHPENRQKNLLLFNQLLKKITERWPDVEFLSSDQLAQIVSL